MKALRKQIDAIDRVLLRLMARRAQVARAVGERKRRLSLPMKDALRERRIVRQRVQHGRALGLDAPTIRKFMRMIITVSRRAQRQK
ncbi:hypothetical protein A3J43_01595 [Candidatus Uhrbacteria bacterium RIFCSPHIGHO2_12_FULL_54_23]|uniref:Chorismate mutase domain-containing protein n=3 Tax=Candidatus Uhriibacteriota TaxID=1752732 RepID=A0A1F7ULU2_9BACT|nr:MAG: hypothetical protein A3J43_01595 [Candidatus Uhrbacteria bacterium RIFCSPHIGHO2_12_FULL_54_23]OGL84019.1 MAG: hypothetical protein A3B36_01510 [Candidatus Uhrbacteria bacterium RIFCSPLOWO2_01_FULL_55_36]OGL90667.1 MAG: hypothetical protein A3J36_03495 [Candidatus Uhrbacteria bacterium RIFCSPLOWO2_02_FULL_54_37]